MTEANMTDAELDAGLAHHEAGRTAEAAALCRHILAREPDHPDALNLLGVILQESGDLPQSISVLSRAVAADPDFAEAFVNLARAQCAAGDPAGAKASSEHAIALDAELAEAHLQLARASLALRDNRAAEAAAARAAALAPHSADAQVFLGHALVRLKDHAAAVAAYRSADRLAPGQYETLLHLGIVLTEIGQLEEAVACCRQATVLSPDDVHAHVALGRALQRARAIPGSIDALRRALEIAPARSDVWKQQGDNFALLGQFDAAAGCYNQVLAVNPASPDALASLVAIGKPGDAASAQHTFRAVLADPARPEMERAIAGFALGALLDGAGDHEAAFTVYAAANQIMRGPLAASQAAPDLIEFRHRIGQLRASFTQATLEAAKGWGDPSEVPVFIVGMPRSGTSLVEQILAAHPRIHGAGERKDIAGISRLLEAGAPHLDPSGWDPDIVRREASRQIARLQALGGSCDRVIDKLPDNILLLGHIAVLFPNARVILCRRDLRDVCLSCFFQFFGGGMPWSYDLADCAARAQEIERLVRHWLAVLPLRILEVGYEALVGNLEEESRRLVGFLGLEWNDSCLSFHAAERVVDTSSLWQVRQPLYASSVDRWRHYRSWIQPLLDGLIGAVPPDGPTVPVPRMLAIARAHRQAGRTEAAAATCRVVAGQEPDNPDVLRLQAQLALDESESAQAVLLLRRAALAAPGEAEVWVELSRACRATGDGHSAAEAVSRAAALDPADPTVQFLLGSVRLDLNDDVGAKAALARAIALAPESADAHLYFAMACMRLSEYADAAKALAEAVRLKPDDAECLTKLGWVLRELGQFQEALPYLRRAVELAPDDGRVHLALVMALWRTNDVAATEVACDRALLIAPDIAELWLHDAFCKAARGRFAFAADSYRKTLALDPSLEEARLGLVGIDRQTDAPVDAAGLRTALEDVARPSRVRAAAGYALGELLDRAGSYDAAFAAFAAANRLVQEANLAASITSEQAAYDRFVDATAAIFSPEAFLAVAGLVAPSDLPVFVVGMPRSGTTLVEQIVSSHRDVFGAGELKDVTGMVPRIEGGTVHLPPIVWDRTVIARESAVHLQKLRDLGGNAKRVVDKMPDNVQWLGHIAVLFPGARIIICRRDPRDVCLSCYFQHFGEGLAWTTDLADLAARACAFDRLVAHWRAALPLPILEVQYEDMVQDLEAGSRRLIAFLGLDWDPACLEFHKTDRTVLTASQWQVRQPLYTSSVGRWRLYRKHLGPLLDGLRPPDLADDEDASGLAGSPPLSIDDLLQGGQALGAGSIASET